MDYNWKCAECTVKKDQRICRTPEGISPNVCPTDDCSELIEKVFERYQEPKINDFAKNASIQEKEGYQRIDGNLVPVKGRLQEIREFAIRMGYGKLGLAFCAGLINEAKILTDILGVWGFEVVSVICKVGTVAKEQLGLVDADKICPGHYESMCNPIAQAEFLNQSATELNIMMGLCVGHDAMFLKNTDAYTTVFAVKDRLYGHNPLAAIYTLGSYSSHLLES